MKRVKKALEIIKDPVARFSILTKYGFHDNLSDEEYLKRLFKLRLGYGLDLDDPKTFNEKIQWLKLYDRKPEYTMMVDKYEVKKYIAKKIGEQYVIPTLGIWNHPKEIDFDSLPKQFVLKCTHNSGLGMYICHDKSKMNKKAVMKGLKKGLKENYYKGGREWPYKNVRPRIIAEKYMEEKGNIVPEDYKMYCINGEPKYIVVFHDRFHDQVKPSESVYDTEWNRIYVSLDTHFEISDKSVSKPKCLDELLRISRRLCRNMPQIRLDFYIIENTIYFGEITFHTASGFQPMNPSELDRILGEELKL